MEEVDKEDALEEIIVDDSDEAELTKFVKDERKAAPEKESFRQAFNKFSQESQGPQDFQYLHTKNRKI